jgi:hypothetical protein
MFGKLAAIVACAALAACTTVQVKSADASLISPPDPHARGLLVQPDVQLASLLASGLHESREDWSRAGQANLSQAISEELSGRSHTFVALDPAASMEGETGQLLRLNDAVGQSILDFEYSGRRLPTHKGTFNWTLGDGAKAIRDEKGVEYALFVTARGSYASAGRVAVMVGAAMLGVSVPLGQQQVFASLVDLRSGQIVWFNVAIAGPSDDMRSPEGARTLVKSLLKGVPL